MKKLIYGSVVMVLLSITMITNSNTSIAKPIIKVKCPLIQLASPPSTLKTGSNRSCENTLTVNTNNCGPFTFTFTWSGGSYVQSTTSGSNVLNFNLPTMANGTTISLVITDCCGGSSNTYQFTSVHCS